MYDFKIFSGSYVLENNINNECALEVGAVYPYCLICKAWINDLSSSNTSTTSTPDSS